MTGVPAPGRTSSRGQTGPLDWLGVVVLVACGALSAWLESLLAPLYLGGVIVPVTLVLTAAGNWYLPRLARTLVPRTIVACLPFLAWLMVIIFMSAGARPEGDVILPGGDTGMTYVGYGVIGVGAVVATISIVMSLPPPQQRPGRPGPPGRPQRPVDSGSTR